MSKQWADDIQDQPVDSKTEAFFVMCAMQIGEVGNNMKAWWEFSNLVERSKILNSLDAAYTTPMTLRLYREYIVWYTTNQKT